MLPPSSTSVGSPRSKITCEMIRQMKVFFTSQAHNVCPLAYGCM